jgi:hypothetical protein
LEFFHFADPRKISMATVFVTLSRVHKIIERLQAMANERFRRASQLTAAVPTRVALTGVQRLRLMDRREEGLRLAAQGAELLAKVGELRELVARENTARGISALLAQQDATKKLIQFYEDLKNQYSPGVLQLEDLQVIDATALAQLEERGPLSVSVLAAAQAQELEALIAQLRRRLYALSDSIAELNAQRVSLELPDDVFERVLGD